MLTVEAAQIETAGALKKGLPIYTLAEVAKHDNKEKRIWVSSIHFKMCHQADSKNIGLISSTGLFNKG